MNKETLREIVGSAKQLTREGYINFIEYNAYYELTLEHYEYVISKGFKEVNSRKVTKRSKDLDLLFLEVFAEIKEEIRRSEESV